MTRTAEQQKRQREHKRAYYQRKKLGQVNPTYRGVRDGSIPALMLDILETHNGTWWTINSLHVETRRIRGHQVNRATVRSGYEHLAETGVILTRKAADGTVEAMTPYRHYLFYWRRRQVMPDDKQYPRVHRQGLGCSLAADESWCEGNKPATHMVVPLDATVIERGKNGGVPESTMMAVAKELEIRKDLLAAGHFLVVALHVLDALSEGEKP